MRVSLFRLSSDREEKLSEIVAFYGARRENFSDQMREFIDEIHKNSFFTKIHNRQVAKKVKENPT